MAILSFKNCVFDGTGPAAYNYKKITMNDCTINSNRGDNGLYITSSADASGSFEAEGNTFVYSDNEIVYTYRNIDFDKNNCFIKMGADYTFNGPKGVTITTDSCYFDDLVYYPGLTVTHTNDAAYCVPDSSLTKVIGSNGKPILPQKYALGSAVPNPFNSNVAIEFDIPKPANVKFEVYNLLGNRITTIVDEKLDRGRYRVV